MIKNRIERFPPYAPVAVLQFPVFLLSERRKAGKSTLLPMRVAVKLQFPVFLLSVRRKAGKSTLPPMREALLFTPVHPSFCGTKPRPRTHQQEKKGKNDKKSDRKISAICTRRSYAISSFPPLGAEESWKIEFTADESSGKAAISSFPPLGAEKSWKMTLSLMRAAVKLQFPVFLLSERRKAGKSILPPMSAAVKLQFPVFLLSERRKV
ncbi:hypothetical protein MRB53_021516 [Persea americana]|uniref:Uncharacterized protein n=1 Tax=Persea americana TaxID=3435 RepID=A0ACC2L438_PERAE|nr:hypothetical protein MRB53_021516 [Persea americana]